MARQQSHTAEIPSFKAPEFATLTIILLIPLAMGAFFCWKHRKNETMSGYFFGGKQMHPIVVGISSAVTCISAFTIIAYPAEAYLVGTVLFWAPIAIGCAAIVTLFLYVPFFTKLQLPTVYTYLELRFNPATKRLVAIMATLSEIFYLSIILYLPAVALNAVTPIPTSWSLIIIGGICTLYTVSGGFQAVLWTDVVQCFFMIFGCLMVFGKGIESSGGLANIIESLENSNRTTFFKFHNYDISSRIHPVTVTLGDFFISSHLFGFTQSMYQRILSCKSTRQSQWSMAFYLIPSTILMCFSISNGLIMYYIFKDCDPIKSGLLKSLDQGVPYVALLQFSSMPGMTGIFVAAVFSGTLSTVSSFLNANANVIVEDVLLIAFPKLTERIKVIAGKICAFALGIISVSFAFVISTLEQNAFQILRSLQGATSGSVLGIYLLGIYTPWANSKGAIFGGAISYFVMVWIFVGSTWLQQPLVVPLPPTSTSGCVTVNSSLWPIDMTVTESEVGTGITTLPMEQLETSCQQGRRS